MQATAPWCSAGELAARALPGVPVTKKGVLDRARKEAWLTRTNAAGAPLARKRSGRGGGWEFHASLLPLAAQRALAAPDATVPCLVRPKALGRAKQRARAAEPCPRQPAAEAWAAFEQLGPIAKGKAERALAVIQQVEALIAAGMGKTAAIDAVAARSDAKRSTINGWFAQIVGVPTCDRLPYLAPAYKGGGKKAEIDAGLWQLLLSDFLRPEQPSWSSCFRRIAVHAAALEMTLPDAKTLQRHMERTVPAEVRVLMREGADKLRLMMPP